MKYGKLGVSIMLSAVIFMSIEVKPALAITSTDTPHYFGPEPNWAYTPKIRKFVNRLPGIGSANQNEIGQFIPIANADTTTYAGSDYYEIALKEYEEKMHPDLPPTRLRGYVQLNNGGPGNSIPPAPIHYLGPLIIAQKDKPVRLKFVNMLSTGTAGNLFLPVDKTVMGAGMGPEPMLDMNGDPVLDGNGDPMYESYTENRATLHNHGANSPWISDGTAHQWITPAGEMTMYPRGVSVQDVPDMPATTPGDGTQYFYWTNQQSARLLFYHDHAWGITRLNVYAGEAAGYLITDTTEQALINSGAIPNNGGGVYTYGIPLVIQDRTWVDTTTITQLDPTWNWGTTPPVPHAGDLWYPHVYMTAQNPADLTGVNPFGRWHYGPWFWPPTSDVLHGPVANPYYDPINAPWEPPQIPGVPHPSMAVEAFMDVPIVNGTPYPVLTVNPQAYRFRVLNAADDRFFNLQLYVADTGGGTGAQATATVAGGGVNWVSVNNPGSGYTSAPTVYFVGGGGTGAQATATVTGGLITSVTLTNPGTNYISAPTVLIGSDKEVKMVPAQVTAGFPELWPTDGRPGGVPDPTTVGPSFLQIGTEGGFLPAPVDIPNQPVTWNTDPTTFNAGNVQDHALLLGCAERADVIIDFSQYAGKTLILYNDAPAAFPALDPRYDYYTGAPDLTDTGGAPTPEAGFAPNTRTIMQIKVTTQTPVAFNPTLLNTKLPLAFRDSQKPIIVAQAEYNNVYNKTFPTLYPHDGHARIQDNEMKFAMVSGATTTMHLEPKALHDEMGGAWDKEYGRMSGKLGIELPMTNVTTQNFIMQNFTDPATEVLQDGTTQIWKITHNGVDTHPIHFHLFDVQLINRVGWDGAIRLPDANELGWKDTVRISPLEDTIVAMRPHKQDLPWPIPDSVRPYNPAIPLHSPKDFTNIDPLTSNPINPGVTNEYANFGWEYTWHCHILGHEEMDMMRPLVFQVASIAPPNLQASALGGGVMLTWADSSASESGFTLDRSLTSNFAVVVSTTVDPSIPNTAYGSVISFLDSTVGFNTQYFYRVRSNSPNGNSAWSNTATITTQGPPASATFLTATRIGGHQVDLAWSYTAGQVAATGFRIERAIVTGGNPGAFTSLGTVAQTVLAFSDITALDGTSYQYKVFSYNAIGDAAPATANIVLPLGAPSAPAGAMSLAAPLTVSLNWTNNSVTATGFTVQRAENTGFTTNLQSYNLGVVTTYINNTTMAANKTYYYRIRATLGGTNSTWSATVTINTAPPAAPIAFTAVGSQQSPTSARVVLSWQEIASVLGGFTIQRATNVGFSQGLTTFRVGSAIRSYTDNNLLRRKRYYYRVQAYNGAGNSAWTTKNLITP